MNKEITTVNDQYIEKLERAINEAKVEGLKKLWCIPTKFYLDRDIRWHFIVRGYYWHKMYNHEVKAVIYCLYWD